MNNRIRFALISVSVFLVFYVVLGGLLGKNGSTSEKTYRNLGVYSEVLSRIKSDYVTEPDLRKVTEGSIRGLLESLDPYSTYLPPEEYEAYQKQPEAGPASVGMFLSKRMGFATVVSVLPGSPAEAAGIRAGDLIDRVEGVPTRDLSVVQIERLLAGQPGSPVSVARIREVRGEPQTVTMTRTLPRYPPVVSKMVEPKTGYLRVATFNKGKAAEISARLGELLAEGADKIVLDLRNCAGGETDEATQTADLFLDKGLITSLQGQRFPRQEVHAQAPGTVFRGPLAVLINQSTAGPAEVVASALLGNGRGEAVGVRSFGVGVYQKMIPVGDGSALLLSIAKYHGPDGNAIHDNGVTPSVVEEPAEAASLDADDDQALEPEHFGASNDQQLRKAIEVLKTKLAEAKAA
jgi:carboxyl-terminal processing protease